MGNLYKVTGLHRVRLNLSELDQFSGRLDGAVCDRGRSLGELAKQTLPRAQFLCSTLEHTAANITNLHQPS